MTECCGKPMTGAEGRLINWEEGNYKVTDQPNPRGEIILGGDSIAKVNCKDYSINVCSVNEASQNSFQSYYLL